MKTLIVGDVHGRFGDLNTLINKQKPELVICCGDFGYWPGVKGLSFDDIKPQDTKILWCDGNHENHWALKERESDEIVPNEVIRDRDLENLPDTKIDIVVSHTCPYELTNSICKSDFKHVEPSNYALSNIWVKYHPELWYFGHWHFYKEHSERGTKFTTLSCLPTYLGWGRWWIELE